MTSDNSVIVFCCCQQLSVS